MMPATMTRDVQHRYGVGSWRRPKGVAYTSTQCVYEVTTYEAGHYHYAQCHRRPQARDLYCWQHARIMRNVTMEHTLPMQDPHCTRCHVPPAASQEVAVHIDGALWQAFLAACDVQGISPCEMVEQALQGLVEQWGMPNSGGAHVDD